jgi:hypothetical protein
MEVPTEMLDRANVSVDGGLGFLSFPFLSSPHSLQQARIEQSIGIVTSFRSRWNYVTEVRPSTQETFSKPANKT